MKTIKVLPFLIICLFVSCNNNEEVVQYWPMAKFTYTIDGRTVTLHNESTDAITYKWSFGDGETSTDIEPVHTYKKDGVYDITLTAIKKDLQATLTKQVSISTQTTVVEDKDYCIVKFVNKTNHECWCYIAENLLTIAPAGKTAEVELYERWITLQELYGDMGNVEIDVIGKSVDVDVEFNDLWDGTNPAPSVTKKYVFQKGRKYIVTIESTNSLKITNDI